MNPFGEPSLVVLRDMLAMHAPTMTPADAWMFAGRPERPGPFDIHQQVEHHWFNLTTERRLGLEAAFRYRYADAMIAARSAKPSPHPATRPAAS